MTNFKTYLKGFLMGTCDIVPGVSGGTIAFITGIYPKLIESINNFSLSLVSNTTKYIFKRDKKNLKKLKQDIKKLNLIFLISLLAGILTAVFLMSGIITYLLKNHFVYTMSFFSGLILASSLIIYNHIKNHKFTNILYGLLGVAVIISLVFFKPSEVANPSYFYLFLGGFLGISAMFLPGISGAFILLIMGLYAPVLESIHNLGSNLMNLIFFGLGIILGGIIISRIITFLFKKYKCKTLYFLLGLVISSLIIPLIEIKKQISFNLINFNLAFMFFILGGFVVLIIELLNQKRERENQHQKNTKEIKTK